MFVWVTLPKKLDTMKLFDAVIKKDVTFVPGRPFYANGGGDNTLRLNYSASTPEIIEEGIKRMGESIKLLMAK